MSPTLELVSDRGAKRTPSSAREPAGVPRPDDDGPGRALAFLPTRAGGRLARRRPGRSTAGRRAAVRAASTRFARRLTEDRGAVTAEYAIVIMAAVAFAGLLVAIMRSEEIRAMLVRLVENALGAGG